jgi:hypothetical protein
LRELALGLPEREVLFVNLDEHVSFRALALALPNREVRTRDSAARFV